MTYDAATGTVVLFGGLGGKRYLGDTWTWDGTTWTQQHPAAHPVPRELRSDDLRRGDRHRGAVRRPWRQTLSRRHLDLGRHDLDPAAPGGPSGPSGAPGDGLRRGDRHRGAVRRGQGEHRPWRYLDLGRHDLDQTTRRGPPIGPHPGV